MSTPPARHGKSDAKLHFSDLTGAPQTKAVTPDFSGTAQTPSHPPVTDVPADPPPSQPGTTHLPDHKPEAEVENPTSTHPPASEQPTPHINPGFEAPVFRNPMAANQSADLIELGATAPAPETVNPDSQRGLGQIVHINLSPVYDSFLAHGLHVDEDKGATTFFGKMALLLKLNVIFSRRNLRYATVGLVSFAIFLLVFNFGTIFGQLSYWINPPKAVAPITTPAPAKAVATQQNAEAIDTPDQIIIPKIKVTTPVVFEPSIAEAAIQKSLQNGVVHYAGTALPGEHSNIVIVGHSSNDWWEPGNYKFIFSLLEKMAPGDQIQFNYQKKKYVFEVTTTKIVEPSEISVLQPTSEAQLTLITCTPPGTSWKRLIVIAKQVQPVPTVPQTTPELASNASTVKAALPGNAPSFFDQIKRFFGFGDKATPTATPTPTPAPQKRNYLPEAA